MPNQLAKPPGAIHRRREACIRVWVNICQCLQQIYDRDESPSIVVTTDTHHVLQWMGGLLYIYIVLPTLMITDLSIMTINDH